MNEDEATERARVSELWARNDEAQSLTPPPNEQERG